MKYRSVIIGATTAIVAAAADRPPTTLDGLSTQVWSDVAEVRMGEAVDFHASITFDTMLASAGVRVINRELGRCDFIFENPQTGQTFHRAPYDVGMPGMLWPGNIARLAHGTRLVLDDMKVHLLSEKGEQVPPGTYLVTLLYSNDARGKTEAYRDSVGQYRSRVYRGPFKLWSGQVASSPHPLRVLPASPAVVEVKLPTELVVDTTTVHIPADGRERPPPRAQIRWTYRKESAQVIRVSKRPGFALGQRWTFETLIDGETASDYPRGMGDLLEAGGHSFLHPDITARILSSTRTEFVLHMGVFESSVQDGHLWHPEGGDFKVLWSGQLRHTFQLPGR